MSSGSYDIRPCGIEHLDTFRQVFQAAYGKSADAGYFQRKWDTGSTGKEMIAHLAFDGSGDPVAYYGVYPQLLRWGESAVWAAQAGDAATHPQHRRAGLFRLLAQATEQVAAEQGIQLLVGFAQHQRGSFIALVQQGWVHVADLTIHRWLTRVPFALRLRRKLAHTAFARHMDHRWNAITLQPEVFDEVAWDHSIAARADGWRGSRDVAFLRFKCGLGSRLVWLPSGHAWIAVQGNTARIGDLFGKDHARLLVELTAVCRRHGVDVLELATTAAAIVDPLLRTMPADSWVSAGGLIVKPLPGSPAGTSDAFLFTGGDVDTF